MGPTQINGLPAHVLLVHLVVVFVPIAALMLIASVAWPAARRRLGVGTPLVALIPLVVVPVTTHAGEWLKDRLPENPRIERHAAERGHRHAGVATVRAGRHDRHESPGLAGSVSGARLLGRRGPGGDDLAAPHSAARGSGRRDRPPHPDDDVPEVHR